MLITEQDSNQITPSLLLSEDNQTTDVPLVPIKPDLKQESIKRRKARQNLRNDKISAR